MRDDKHSEYHDLLDANKRSTSHAEHLPSILALKDWLGVHPEGANELSKVLSNGELPKELAAQLVYTLELSGANELSQQVLADLLDPVRCYPKFVQVQSAVAAGGLQTISPSLSAALFKVAFDPPVSAQDEGYASQNAALLALGTIARNDLTIANTLADSLILNLQDPTINANADLTVVALLALKNGAIYNPDLLTAAQSLLVQNKDEHVRMAALDYLAGSKEDNHILIEGALKDPVDTVRIKSLELLTASGNPSESAISSALNILSNPKESEQLRMTAVNLLAPYRAKDTRVDALFQNIQTDQPESTIAVRIEQTNK